MRSLTTVFVKICLAILLVTSWNWASAQDAKPAASSGQYKIGVINRKQILEGYKKVKAEYEKLQTEVTSRQAKIDELSKKIDDAKKAYEGEKEKLTPSERAERETTIQNDYRDYQAKLASNQADIDTKEKTMMKGVFEEIDTVVDKIGADEGYHIILEGGSRGGAVYFSPTVDISQKVVDALNSGAGAAPEPAAKTPEKAAPKSEKSKK